MKNEKVKMEKGGSTGTRQRVPGADVPGEHWEISKNKTDGLGGIK